MKPFILCLLTAVIACGEIITSDRRVTWQDNAGVVGGIPSITTRFGSVISAYSGTAGTINTALGNCPAGQYVELGAGTFNISTDIDINDDEVVLRGQGPGVTMIVFAESGIPRIRIRKSFGASHLSTDANLSVDAVKGESTITLASVPSWVTAGELIGIDQIDDTAFVESQGEQPSSSFREDEGNGERSMSQLNKVVSKTATVITLQIPLYYGFKTSQTAQIWKPYYNVGTTTSIKRVGIEDLTLNFPFVGGADSHAASIECGDEVWFHNVEFDHQSGGNAVWPVFSFRTEFRRCYVHESGYLGGGGGYGFAPWHASAASLCIDNIFEGMHNAMTCNNGASGNVFAYNYEVDGASDSGQNPSMNTHSVHVHENIWEGNYCEDKVLFDFTHGSGSHNTVFRNRITGENGSGDSRCCISIERFNRYNNVVGNILGTNGLQNKYISHSGDTAQGSAGSIMKLGGDININNDYSPADAFSYTSGLFILVHGNWDYVQDVQTWEGTIADHDLPNSLVYSSKPSFFNSLAWPPFDPANPGAASADDIPAGYRYLNGGNDPPPESGGGTATATTATVTNLNVQ